MKASTTTAEAVQTRKEERQTPKRPGTPTRHSGISEVKGGFWIRARAINPKTGKWKEKAGTVLGISIGEALVTQEQWQQELLAPAQAVKPLTTLTVCAKSYLTFCREQNEGRSTRENKVQIFGSHVLPYLGDHFIQRVDDNDLEGWLTDISRKPKKNGEPYSEETIKTLWRRFCVFYSWCMKPYGIATDATATVDLRRCLNRELQRKVQARKGPNTLTEEQLVRFLKAARELYPQHYAMILLGYFTGLRWSELSALRWEHFNQQTWEIEIRQSQFRGTVRERTKSGDDRAPSFNEQIWAVLEEHRATMLRTQAPGFSTGLVFPSRKGKPRYASVMSKPFPKICAAAEIPKKLSTKVFRRTWNDLSRKAGVDQLVKLAMIGHADLRTNQLYTSVDHEEKQAALAKIFDLVGGIK